jgi:hypothetical protein
MYIFILDFCVGDYATHAVHDVELRSGGQNGTKKFWRSRCDGRFDGGQTLLQAVGRLVAEHFEAELCESKHQSALGFSNFAYGQVVAHTRRYME